MPTLLRPRVEWNASTESTRIGLPRNCVLRSAKTIAEANMILQGGFIEKLNKKFAHPPMASKELHVRLRPHQDLRDIFCFEQARSMAQDWAVRCKNRFYQLLRDKEPLPRTASKVIVLSWLNGLVNIIHRGRRILY